MSQTPIYDQLCSERINTDVLARHRDRDRLIWPRLVWWQIPVIVATPEVFGSCDGWGSAGFGAADGEA